METHLANAYLDYLISPEGTQHAQSKLYILKKPKSMRPKNSILHHPAMGEYQLFTWRSGFDPQKEVVVTVDGYSPAALAVPHAHDFFEIVYVYSGDCKTHISDQAKTLHSGDLCLYNLQAVHQMTFSQPGDVIFNILVRREFFRQMLLELLSQSDIVSSFFLNSLYNRSSEDSCILLHPDTDYQCEQMTQKIIETYFQEPPMCQTTLKSLLMQLLLEMSRQHRDAPQRSKAAAKLSVEDVLSFININCQTVSLESLAAHFGYSSRSMTRFLLRYTGYSFRDVLKDIRFSRARLMLQDSCLPLDEIAAAIGYTERSNFEIAFKKYCHITPSAYRRQFSTVQPEAAKDM